MALENAKARELTHELSNDCIKTLRRGYEVSNLYPSLLFLLEKEAALNPKKGVVDRPE
jgi:hypothetical protein